MMVKILLFARYAEIAGSRELEVDLPASRTVGEVWNSVREKFPALAEIREIPLVACDRKYSRFSHRVRGGEEIAFFPPVGGG